MVAAAGGNLSSHTANGRRVCYAGVAQAVAGGIRRPTAVFGAPHRINITNMCRRSYYAKAVPDRRPPPVATASGSRALRPASATPEMRRQVVMHPLLVATVQIQPISLFSAKSTAMALASLLR